MSLLLRYQVRHQSYKIYFYLMTNLSITTKANKFANEEGHSYHYDHYSVGRKRENTHETTKKECRLQINPIAYFVTRLSDLTLGAK